MQPKPYKIKMTCVMQSTNNVKTIFDLLDEGLSFKEINNYFKKCMYNSYEIKAKSL